MTIYLRTDDQDKLAEVGDLLKKRQEHWNSIREWTKETFDESVDPVTRGGKLAAFAGDASEWDFMRRAEHEFCRTCNGTGEGARPEDSCSACGGSGTSRNSRGSNPPSYYEMKRKVEGESDSPCEDETDQSEVSFDPDDIPF